MKKTKMIISNEKARKVGIEGKFPCGVCRKVVASKRSSRSQMFFKVGFLKKTLHRKILKLESLFNEVEGLQFCNFIK